MIKADELKYLTDIEKKILARYSKGYPHAQVTYMFEEYPPVIIDVIKQMLLEHGYDVNEVRLGAGSKEVGVIFNIFW